MRRLRPTAYAGRAEFLPVMWHDALHSDATGVDEQLHRITLRSIPKLRQYTNGTLMDILFYTSPNYCQFIVNTVGKEVLRLRTLFLSRNPGFKGNYSFIGHSLGSIIAFDILANQNGPNSDLPSSYTTVGTEDAAFDEGEHLQPVESNSDVAKEGETGQTVLDADEHGADVASRLETFEGWSFVGNKRNNHRDLSADQLTSILTEAGLNDDQVCSLVDSLLHIKSQNLSKGPSNSSPPLSSATAPIEITSSTHRPFWVEDQAKNSDAVVRGFGMPVVTYPQLGFHVTGLFLLGSPLPLFLTARGIRQLSPDYQLPTCVMFYNIFHPFDPVAYRMETMIDPTYQPRAVLMPHHKGRKRFHLQLKEDLARVGSDLKSRFFQSMQYTWRTLQGLLTTESSSSRAEHGDGREESSVADDDANAFRRLMSRLTDAPTSSAETEEAGADSMAGSEHGDQDEFRSQLNQGRRIDYMLQEAPLESFSAYLFALGSHAAYWESEDTALFLLNAVYSTGVPYPPSAPLRVSEAPPSVDPLSAKPISSAAAYGHPMPTRVPRSTDSPLVGQTGRAFASHQPSLSPEPVGISGMTQSHETGGPTAAAPIGDGSALPMNVRPYADWPAATDSFDTRHTLSHASPPPPSLLGAYQQGPTSSQQQQQQPLHHTFSRPLLPPQPNVAAPIYGHPPPPTQPPFYQQTPFYPSPRDS